MELERRPKDEFGAMIKARREEKGISLEEMSKLTGLSVNKIADFEANGTDLPVTKFFGICIALEIENPDEFIYKSN